jgi:hypothetical protein
MAAAAGKARAGVNNRDFLLIYRSIMRLWTVKYLLIFAVSFLGGVRVFAQGADTAKRQGAPASQAMAPAASHVMAPAASQQVPNPARAVSDTSLPPNIPRPVYGPNDTIIVPAKIYDGELLPANNIQYDYVRAPMTAASRKRLEEWTRLRNAVYVTYPYARRAGLIMNEMNAKMVLMTSESERKAYIQSREKDLKKEFTQPLEQLSIYQGKILMKLINRQTGNNCYDIIKEYRGGFTARFWQTVAFFFSSNLKQPYDPKGDDQAIEVIVEEVERMYRG